MTGGILLSSSAENSGIGFGYGLLIAIGTCFLLKLLAVVLQQKMIGELCGSRSVYIRYLVGINSVELRAMKVVLEKPGMTFSKVVVLGRCLLELNALISTGLQLEARIGQQACSRASCAYHCCRCFWELSL